MITYIQREKLEAHPDNPRKDLGDLGELVQSIIQQGLLQNLTVVPSPDKPGMYRIVIGHRRAAAAKIAGMKELPCVIDERMSYEDQLAVMMSENIQRSDLTVAERVGGVQLMMDLGMDAGRIADKTGISSSTVYRYAKLARLGRTELAKAEQRGATLMQMAACNEIEDDQLRAQAIGAAGTPEFNVVIQKAKREKLKAEKLPGIRAMFAEAGATEMSEKEYDYKEHMWLDYLRYEADDFTEIRKLIKKQKTPVRYSLRDYDIALYAQKVKDPDEDIKAAEARARREMIEERARRENELAKRFRELRDDFVANYLPMTSADREIAVGFAIWVFTRPQFQYAPQRDGLFAREVVPELDKEPEAGSTSTLMIGTDDILELSNSRSWRGLIIGGYERVCGQASLRMMDPYTGKYKPGAIVEGLYRWLEEMGYKPCAEEIKWLEGTHEVYLTEA